MSGSYCLSPITQNGSSSEPDEWKPRNSTAFLLNFEPPADVFPLDGIILSWSSPSDRLTTLLLVCSVASLAELACHRDVLPTLFFIHLPVLVAHALSSPALHTSKSFLVHVSCCSLASNLEAPTKSLPLLSMLPERVPRVNPCP